MIVTFYSYKGGVGRSMAMANVADLLARGGRKVLIVDFDLEAPGLEQYFQINQAAARRNPGLLDLLLSYKRAMSVASGDAETDEFRQIERYIVPVYQTLPGGGRLDLLPAGQREGREQLDRYAAALRTFDWQDFYFNWEGELFFEWLRNELVPSRYDIALVDSRTGVTEMGGVCTYQLADVVVMLCAANHQNRQGTRSVALDFESSPVQTARRDRALQIVVVPARVEQRSTDLFEQFIASFQEDFAAYLPGVLRENGLGFRELTIPYEPVYAFEERVLSDPTQGLARREIAAAFERLAKAVLLLTDGRVEKAVPAGQAATSGTLEAGAVAQFDPAKRFAGYDVFLSYDAADKEHVDKLTAQLEAAGLDVFTDAHQVTAGADWHARMEQVLFHSKVCMLAYGSHGVGGVRQDDLLRAIRAVSAARELRVLPVLLPGADGERVKAEVGADIARARWLDCRNGTADQTCRNEIARLAYSLKPPEPAATSTTAEYGAPYLELNPFKERDAGLFFGRDHARVEVAGLVERLPLVAIAGPSGSGKTSFVIAGVVPELRRRAGTDSESGWLFARCTPREGLQSLDRALQALTPASGSSSRHRLLFVDDLEHVTFGELTEETRTFIRRIDELIGGGGFKVIVAIRDDCIAAVAAVSPRLPLSGETLYALPALTPAEIQQLIEGPAQKVGLAFEPGLVDRIVGDWGEDQRFLPFLQSVLRSLWERRREGFLTNRAYEAIPDPVEAIAESTFAAMSPVHQQVAARLLPRLIRLCGDLDLGRSCARSELMDSGSASDLNATLETMIDKRLIHAFAIDGEPRVAPAFTSVQWPRAEQWMADDADFLEWLERLDHYRRDWISNGSDPGALLAGALLSEAREWLARRPQDLNYQERDYILKSAEAARKRKQQRFAAAALVVLLIGAFVGKTLFDQQRQTQAVEHERQLDDLVRSADQAASSGEIDTAIQRYSDVLDREPDHQEARIARGTLLDAQGKQQQAIDDFTIVINATTDAALRSRALVGRGVAKLHMKNLEPARDDLNQAVELAPNNPIPLSNRAVVYEALNDLQSAVRDYSAALKLAPDLSEALFNRGVLYIRLNRGDLATKDFESILALDVDAKTKQAAAYRLEALGARLVPVESRTYTVQLYHADQNDKDTFDFVAESLASDTYKVERVTSVSQQPSSPVVRYFFKEDEAAAANVRRVTESALAKRGYNIRLQTVHVPLPSAGDRRGELHVRVPSLRLRALSTDLYRQAPVKK